MMNPIEAPAQVIYQADPATLGMLQQLHDRMHSICSLHKHRKVSVQLIDGQHYEGTIVHIEKGFLYLRVTQHPGYRQWAYGAFYNDVILPLVLYQLLVITLLS